MKTDLILVQNSVDRDVFVCKNLSVVIERGPLDSVKPGIHSILRKFAEDILNAKVLLN